MFHFSRNSLISQSFIHAVTNGTNGKFYSLPDSISLFEEVLTGAVSTYSAWDICTLIRTVSLYQRLLFNSLVQAFGVVYFFRIIHHECLAENF